MALTQSNPAVYDWIKEPKQKVWATFQYTCECCKRTITVQLAEGVEGPREQGQEYWVPAPFLVGCDICTGFMMHSNWNQDKKYDKPIRAESGYMFIMAGQADCGKLVRVARSDE